MCCLREKFDTETKHKWKGGVKCSHDIAKIFVILLPILSDDDDDVACYFYCTTDEWRFWLLWLLYVCEEERWWAIEFIWIMSRMLSDLKPDLDIQ
jgi:hypothetical protein